MNLEFYLNGNYAGSDLYSASDDSCVCEPEGWEYSVAFDSSSLNVGGSNEMIIVGAEDIPFGFVANPNWNDAHILLSYNF